jgi:hypothetical protein
MIGALGAFEDSINGKIFFLSSITSFEVLIM